MVLVRQTERRTMPTSEFQNMANTLKTLREMKRIWHTVTAIPAGKRQQIIGTAKPESTHLVLPLVQVL